MLNDSPQPAISRRTALWLGLGGVIAAGATPVSRATAWDTRWQPLADRIQKAIAEKMLPGMQLAVMKEGKLIYSAAYGSANFETRTAATTSSIYRIASCSKQFTAAGILALAEEGRLSVDDKLAKYIPDFPQADSVSLRQILTHTAGLGNYTRTQPREAYLQVSRSDRTDVQMLELIKATEPVYISKPGTGWSYSNTGFALLAMIIGRLTHAPYGEYLRTRIFDRAGLSRTRVDDASEIVVGRVSGYTQDKKAPSGFRNASFVSMTFTDGAGSLRSTAEELCAWHAALLGGKVLRQESVDQMLTPARLSNGELPPASDRPGPMEYGFGLALTDANGHRAIAHRGTIQGFRSDLATWVKERVSVAYLTNTDPLGGGEKEINAFGPDLQAQAFKIALG